MISKPNRRNFLQTTAAIGVASLSGIAWPHSANNRVRIGIVGVHGRGRDLARALSRLDGAEIAALADVDSRLLPERAEEVEKLTGKRPETVQDFRRLLDDPAIDALLLATPDHWHALGTIWGCEAGKDVYVEKPTSHNMNEDRLMIEAADRSGRVVQVGTQRRSAPFLAEAREYIGSGALGDIGMARVWYMANRPEIGRKSDSPVPDGVDYDLWLGPAPNRPFNENRFHYEWHWNWDYGTGELGNNGIHGVDMVRALLGIDLPHHIASGGGMRMYDDDRISPDVQVVAWDYPDLTLLYEQRQRGGGTLYGSSFGVALYGSKETLVSDGSGWEVHRGEEIEKHPGGLGETEHLQNFLDCIRDRKTPNASLQEGSLSTALCHMGNISHRVGQSLEFDPDKMEFVDNDKANSLLGRNHREPYTPAGGTL